MTGALYLPPTMTGAHIDALGKIAALHHTLRHQLGNPHRWTGTVRAVQTARNTQASNSIEGHDVTADEALDITEGRAVDDADSDTAVVESYRRAMTFVLQLRQAQSFTFDVGTINALHFMLAEADLNDWPGRWRDGPIYITRTDGSTVYNGPDAGRLDDLMASLVDSLNNPTGEPIIDAAMAHLNLVGIHPFKDGNGRAARIVQALVLARGDNLPPELISIEEYLRRNTDAYYTALGAVDNGGWNPGNDTDPWVRFVLNAQWTQAHTIQARFNEAAVVWEQLEALTRAKGMPDRSVDVLHLASLGYRITNSVYRDKTNVSPNLASRDLAALSDAGLLDRSGDRRSAEYRGTPEVAELWREARAARPSVSPLFDERSSSSRGGNFL